MAIGGGARALGMGGAFTAVASDASAVFWNPAGMSGFEKRQLLFMHSERFGDLVNYNFASFVSPTSSFVSSDREASFGIALMHQGVDDIIIANDSNTQIIDTDGDGIFEPLHHADRDVHAGEEAGRIHYPWDPARPPETLFYAADGILFGRRQPGRVRPGNCCLVVAAPYRGEL